MPKRKTVSVDVIKIELAAKKYDWSSAAISRKIGKHDRWLSEVKRGRNLPSPEEAAQMCAILQVRPENILTEPEDIALVQSLLDSQKTPADKGERIPHAALREYLVGQGVRIMLDADAKVTEQTIVNTLKKLSELQEQNDK